jgi:hypothetical protein
MMIEWRCVNANINKAIAILNLEMTGQITKAEAAIKMVRDAHSHTASVCSAEVVPYFNQAGRAS